MRALWLNQVLAKGRSLLGRSRDGLGNRRGSRAAQFDGGSSGDPMGNWERGKFRSKVDGAGLRMAPPSSADLSSAGEITGAGFEISLLNSALPEYEIIEMLDRGGQGTVYRAVQKSTGRLVALKVLHFDPHASRTRLQRFEREVALVARLRHPHVVTIYDRGLISDRPYLSMELIDGLPIDDYVLLNRPSVDACVTLFEKVCRAVASVHQRGVIHRDLKPSNILVDLEGEPHILDFGLAKSFDDESGELSLSVAGQVVGTLPYLSPEQVAGEEGGVDIRTDIYSLGVILHLLLTGAMPYSVNGPVDQVRRNITDQVPATLERHRGTDTDDGAVGAISSDLSHIVLKALAKDKARRYQSADALADDLRRYLEGDAVAARGDGGWYLLRKTARRYRVHAVIASSFVLLLTGSLTGMTVLWQRATKTAHVAKTALRMGSYVRLGGIRRDEGRNEQAIEMCQKAIEIGMQFDGDDLEIYRQLYSAYASISQIFLFQPERREECKKYCDSAYDLAVRLAGTHPDEPEYRKLLAYANRLKGRVSSRYPSTDKKWDEAQAYFEKAIALFHSLPTSGSELETAPIAFEAAVCQSYLGNVLLRNGKRTEGLKLLSDDRLALIRICELYPDSMDYLLELVRVESRIGEWLLRGTSSIEIRQGVEVLTSAESRLNKAFDSRLADSRKLDAQELLSAIKINKAKALRRLAREEPLESGDQTSPSALSGVSTGSSAPSSIGSGASDFQKE